jgi:anthranilate synthase/aminodeoxychorismate synthase-like glutamine amidotransferase
VLLLIDNYDSFTHNLARYFIELGQETKVVRNNEIDCDGIAALSPDYLVISPGPGRPEQAGVTLSALEQFIGKLPILGVCLGHQAIGQVLGGSVCQADEILHGKTSSIQHTNSPLFAEVPNPFVATRYHSLVLDKTTLPTDLRVTAWTQHKPHQEVMAIEHNTLPVAGVQFHPESLLTHYGHQILKNFLLTSTTLY